MARFLTTGILSLGGIALGAAAYYFLEPTSGNRRRSLAKDKLQSKFGGASETLKHQTTDLSNRARGLASELRAKAQIGEVTDDVLAKRVSSRLGHFAMNAKDISVTVESGRVTLSGLAYEQEIQGIEKGIKAISGVKEFSNLLMPRADSDQYERLRAERGTLSQSQDFLAQGQQFLSQGQEFLAKRNWQPSAKVLTGVAGGALLLTALWKGGAIGKTLMGLGLPLVTGLLADLPSRTWSNVENLKSVNIDKTIDIDAPIEQVFDFFGHFPNFPNFMRNIREVQDLGNGKSHWKVRGPAGADVQFDSVVTRFEPNSVLSWKTTEDATVENSGSIHFDELSAGRTRVRVQMTYVPPAGVLGNAVSTLFGANPKKEMDEDLNRAKTFIETGSPAKDAAQPIAGSTDVSSRTVQGASSGLYDQSATSADLGMTSSLSSTDTELDAGRSAS